MENKTIEQVRTNRKERDKQIALLIIENEGIGKKVSENRTNFKNWLDEKFSNNSIDSDRIEISDDFNRYTYTIEDEFLKLKKNIRKSGFGFGFGMHPMDFMMDMMYEKQKETEEVLYEGNYVPKDKSKLKVNIFEQLKEDLLNKGEISMGIKKYIHEDRKMRIELQNEEQENRSKISKLENENRSELQEVFKSEFSKEKVTEMFKNKETIKDFDFHQISTNAGYCDVKAIKFKKETDKTYYLEFLLSDEEEETVKVNKKDFSISRYIKTL